MFEKERKYKRDFKWNFIEPKTNILCGNIQGDEITSRAYVLYRGCESEWKEASQSVEIKIREIFTKLRRIGERLIRSRNDEFAACHRRTVRSIMNLAIFSAACKGHLSREVVIYEMW